MDSNLHENIVLYDWLSFTSKYHTPKELIEALGLSDCPWTDIPGAHGYKDRKYFGHISIHYNGRESAAAASEDRENDWQHNLYRDFPFPRERQHRS